MEYSGVLHQNVRKLSESKRFEVDVSRWEKKSIHHFEEEDSQNDAKNRSVTHALYLYKCETWYLV